MKILCSIYNWFNSGTSGISGGEIYLLNLIRYLRTQGNEFRMITAAQNEYEYDGIKCYPQGQNGNMFLTNNENVQWCDIILTQLLGCAYGCNKAQQHTKPVVFIAHNNSESYPIKWAANKNIIYNSYQAREDLAKTFGGFNDIVCHPVITPYKKSNGAKITLVNCSKNKGGHLLGLIAEKLPQYEFIGVYGGYQDQIECHLPNITYLANGTDMQKVYDDTKILICPSEFESYGQCAAEAMTAGIPVIAHPTPGLEENLTYAGIFISRDDINTYIQKIVHLIENQDNYNYHSFLSLKRAKSCKDMNDEELVKVNNWLNKIK